MFGIENGYCSGIIQVHKYRIYKNVYEEGFESELKDILIEECFEKDGKTYVTGHTTEYVKVVCEGNVEEINSLVTVTMSKERFGKCILGFR